MEKEILNWQEMWKKETATEIKTDELVSKLNKIGKKDKLERIIMLAFFPFTIAILLKIIPFFDSIYFSLAIISISIGIMIIIFQAYKNRFDIIKNEYLSNNKTYVSKYIKKLKGKILLTSRYMWLYAFFLSAGINLAYIESLKSYNLSDRLLIHALLTIGIFTIMYFSIKRKIKVYKSEINPLIDILENLKEE